MSSWRLSARRIGAGIAGLFVTSGLLQVALAAPPPDVEASLQKIGRIVDPACTAELYRPMMPKNDITSAAKKPYPGITVSRNLSFGPDPKDVVDIFVSDTGPAKRPVLLFIPGGAGNKIEIQNKAANAFYDNIARWATRNGMVGVLMQRKASPTWDGGAKDVAAMVQWMQAHIADYHGDAEKMVIFAHSAGNGPMGTYLGRPELWGEKGVGVKGAIFMSGAPFDVAPQENPPLVLGELLGTAGKTCGDTVGMASAMSEAGALPGVPPGGPGGTSKERGMPPPPQQPDPAVLLAHSSLPALRKASFKMLIVNGAIDPPGLLAIGKNLHEAVCGGGSQQCPQFIEVVGHGHMSLVFSFDSPDTSVSGPVLTFIRGAVK
jgi:pimeloyl-ACP methyl ester carboxylesterase